GSEYSMVWASPRISCKSAASSGTKLRMVSRGVSKCMSLGTFSGNQNAFHILGFVVEFLNQGFFLLGTSNQDFHLRIPLPGIHHAHNGVHGLLRCGSHPYV